MGEQLGHVPEEVREEALKGMAQDTFGSDNKEAMAALAKSTEHMERDESTPTGLKEPDFNNKPAKETYDGAKEAVNQMNEVSDFNTDTPRHS
jgi:hypothetical protein